MQRRHWVCSMTDILFSPEAINDLKEIREYIAMELENDAAAKKVISDIFRKIRTLQTFPEGGKLLSAAVGQETDYRFLVCGNYIAFYRAEDQNVLISRVLYGRRNYMQILFGEPFAE